MPHENRLLATLSPEERQRLVHRLEIVVLPKGKVLYDAGDAVEYGYFPIHGLISLMAITTEGDTIEAAMIGSEGFVGLPIVFDAIATPHQVVAHLNSSALRIRAEALRAEVHRAGSVSRVLLSYANDVISEISRSLMCLRFHSTTERLSRWLLAAHDHAGGDTLELTHEFMAHVLGVPRSIVSEAAIELQDAGLIAYRHGRVVITSREGLMLKACECYRVSNRRPDRRPAPSRTVT